MKKEEFLHLFRFSYEILNVIDLNTVNDTFSDMLDMKINQPPYKKFAIELSPKFFKKMNELLFLNTKKIDDAVSHTYLFCYEIDDLNTHEWNYKVTSFVNWHDGKVYKWRQLVLLLSVENKSSKETIEELFKFISYLEGKILTILIVLLATKNHIKENKIDKDLAQGRFNKKQAYRKDYPITTTISIGKITETYESKGGTGTAKRPHMRRGHIRTQHYGPKNELTQKIFIQPVFVNADEGWIAERRAYNVGK